MMLDIKKAYKAYYDWRATGKPDLSYLKEQLKDPKTVQSFFLAMFEYETLVGLHKDSKLISVNYKQTIKNFVRYVLTKRKKDFWAYVEFLNEIELKDHVEDLKNDTSLPF